MYSCALDPRKNEIESVRDDLSVSLFPIELLIVEKLYDICLNGFNSRSEGNWNSDTYWTAQVKEQLSNIGTDLGFLVYPIKDKATGKFKEEWLFDLVWVDARRNESGQFDYKETRGLKLACESEWNASQDSILDDFLKLTFAYADLRLFIYTNKTIKTNSGNLTPSQLCKSVCATSRGHRFLLIGFPPNEKVKFQVDAWTA